MKKKILPQHKNDSGISITNAELIEAVKEGTKQAIVDLLMSYPDLMSGIMEDASKEAGNA